MSTHRHYGLPRKQQLMRPDQAHRQRMRRLWHAVQLIIGLFLVLAVYGWAGASDAAAEAKDAQFRAEKNFSHLLNGGTFAASTGSTTDALKCEHVIYEKGNK